MLIGEFHHNIDDKCRLVIPTKFREILGDKIIITRGIEQCLNVYSEENWNNLVSKLSNLSFTKKDTRTFTRMFFASANDCTFDKSGRILISEPQMSYADLRKSCVIIGVNDRLEIWSLENYEKFEAENIYSMETISENLFEVENAL